MHVISYFEICLFVEEETYPTWRKILDGAEASSENSFRRISQDNLLRTGNTKVTAMLART
jgi:hypothetical protein